VDHHGLKAEFPGCRTCRGAVASCPEELVALNAPVVDETGLSGTYDFNLRWSPDAAIADDVPALSTALQEQLGLKLERRRTSAEFLVIDRFERPAGQ
jgi:uncharacterized protein (TIGR03435 family)